MFALRRNRFTASVLAVGFLALGAFATHTFSTADSGSQAVCSRACP
ncbi:MAG TPA: hypothetical protein VFG33_36285 [Kribbella sp.]|nr:hypothetical protein [Kribbella sp.]HET6298885.1 hypothetical protein [Kribbella sp.]